MAAESLDQLKSALSGRYTIERELGRGGNAVVYLAHDLKHSRKVALKVLNPELALSVRIERFLREIQIAARLSHPHILTLIDSGQAAESLFYVMPYVEGESLRDRLNREKQLAVADAIKITTDVAAALSYAHAQGVVHRDIKPENILLGHGSEAVVADFGIARALSVAVGEGVTEGGIAIGTPAYMSPEQGAGSDQVDERSDLYSLGCVLYEMLAGRPPFLGATAQEVLARHSLDPVPSLNAARRGVPAAIESAVRKALAKQPADRFPGALEFAAALTSPRAPSGRRWWVPVTAAVAVLLLLVGVARKYLMGSRAPDPAELSVGVIPFNSLSNDPENENFADGMTEDLIDALNAEGLLRVPGRSSSFLYKKQPIEVRRVAADLGVAYLLTGSVRRAGRHYRVTAELTRARDNYQIWSDKYDRDLTDDASDVFAIQDSIRSRIMASLRVTLAARSGPSSSLRYTRDLQAYDLYQTGRADWNKRTPESLRKAVSYFQQAIARDSGFALAYSGLAGAYIGLREQAGLPRDSALPLARRAALRSIQIDSMLAQGWVSLGRVRQEAWDWRGADSAFLRALRLDPKNALAHGWYGLLKNLLGPQDTAISHGRLAVGLDSGSAIMHNILGQIFRRARLDVPAESAYRRAIALEPATPLWHANLALTLVAQGRYAEALAELDSAGGATRSAGLSGYIAAQQGDTAQARRIAAQLAAAKPPPWVALARVYVGLGDVPRALTALERAVYNKESIVYLAFEEWDPLRAEPRFQSMVEFMGIPR